MCVYQSQKSRQFEIGEVLNFCASEVAVAGNMKKKKFHDSCPDSAQEKNLGAVIRAQ
jgi:hypothetical protein